MPLTRRLRLLIVLAAAASLNSSCGGNHSASDAKLLGMFSDFGFVGIAPYSRQVEAQVTVPHHGQAQLPLPNHLEAGQQYIFHHRRPVDDEQLALVTLRTKLQAEGLKIKTGPQSATDLMYLVYGGPLFKFQFSDRDRKGVIFNRPCPVLTQTENGGGQWVEEDYVLAIVAQR